MKLVITVCATKNYCYALKSLGRRLAANLAASQWTEPGVLIVAGDNSPELGAACKAMLVSMPDNWVLHRLDVVKEDPAAQNYKEHAQILIAKMRSAAFSLARKLQAEFCWSLDSDTLPPSNALRCMLDMLRFDAGYYSVSTCPYPNEAFLGGFGTPQNPIAQDFTEEERVLPDDLKAEIAALKKEAAETEPGKITQPTKEWIARKEKVEERVRECPPTGNIWEVIAKHGWRRRGWLDNAYPAIGRGSVVPSDWCGFGCTLLNREALALAEFDGYDGRGTEDLFIVWRRWHPARLRINVITHCPCDHVIWAKKKGGDAKEYTLIRSYHEEHGEAIGHLRTSKSPWSEF